LEAIFLTHFLSVMARPTGEKLKRHKKNFEAALTTLRLHLLFGLVDKKDLDSAYVEEHFPCLKQPDDITDRKVWTQALRNHILNELKNEKMNANQDQVAQQQQQVATRAMPFMDKIEHFFRWGDTNRNLQGQAGNLLQSLVPTMGPVMEYHGRLSALDIVKEHGREFSNTLNQVSNNVKEVGNKCVDAIMKFAPETKQAAMDVNAAMDAATDANANLDQLEGALSGAESTAMVVAKSSSSSEGEGKVSEGKVLSDDKSKEPTLSSVPKSNAASKEDGPKDGGKDEAKDGGKDGVKDPSDRFIGKDEGIDLPPSDKSSPPKGKGVKRTRTLEDQKLVDDAATNKNKKQKTSGSYSFPSSFPPSNDLKRVKSLESLL